MSTLSLQRSSEDNFPPWFFSPCISTTQISKEDYLKKSPPTCLSQFCGFLFCRAARFPTSQYDIGDSVPFLPSNRPAEPTDVPCPPAPSYHRNARYSKSYGIHSPVCFGCCLVAASGRDRLIWIALLLLLVPTILYLVFVANKVLEEFGLPLLIVVSVCAILAHFFLLLTFFVEPGILPTIDFEESLSDEEVQHEDDRPTKHVYVFLYGRYFDKRVFRAQRSRFTSSMLENFDHYCPWVSNAVAKRNYRYFLFFIFSCFLFGSSVAITSAGVLIKRSLASSEHDSWLKELENDPVCGLMAVYALIMTTSILNLLFYHVKIICKGETTSENLKNKFAKGNPYNLGCSNNWALLCCGPHWPSRVLQPQEPVLRHDLTQLLLSPSSPRSAGVTRPTTMALDEHSSERLV